eukprot:7709343-Pyramimonas_sp.AAC.1
MVDVPLLSFSGASGGLEYRRHAAGGTCISVWLEPILGFSGVGDGAGYSTQSWFIGGITFGYTAQA